jgi:hypothetical protein
VRCGAVGQRSRRWRWRRWWFCPLVSTNENLEILKAKLDPDGEGSVTVYKFADYTDDFGLLKAYIRSVKPESALEKPPESKGTSQEILKKSIFVENALGFDINELGPIRSALEDAAGSSIFKSIKFETGMLVEFVAVEHITHLLDLDLTKVRNDTTLSGPMDQWTNGPPTTDD